jgi:hypothetical protein
MKSEAKLAIIILIVIGIIVTLCSNPIKIGPHSRPIPVLTDKELACQTNSDCTLTDIQCCNNNAPDQNKCINKDAVADWKQRLVGFCTNPPVACPEFWMLANYSCSCENSKCVTNQAK